MARTSMDSLTRSLDRSFKNILGKMPKDVKKTLAAGKTKTVAASSAPKAPKSTPGKRTIKLGIERDASFMYFIKDGAVWRVPRKRPGMPKGKKEKVRQFAEPGSLDYASYLYYLDGAGNVVMNPRKNRR